MILVPLSPVPSQALSIVLALQNCRIRVYQKTTGLYFDLSVDTTPIVNCVIARDGVKLVDQTYQGLVGNFAFIDTQGDEDPIYSGLGSRWVLAYYEAADL